MIINITEMSIKRDHCKLFKILQADNKIKNMWTQYNSNKIKHYFKYEINDQLTRVASLGSLKILDVILNTEEYKDYDVTKLFNIIPIKKLSYLTDYLIY
jgi:hypothetical protein